MSKSTTDPQLSPGGGGREEEVKRYLSKVEAKEPSSSGDEGIWHGPADREERKKHITCP